MVHAAARMCVPGKLALRAPRLHFCWQPTSIAPWRGHAEESSKEPELVLNLPALGDPQLNNVARREQRGDHEVDMYAPSFESCMSTAKTGFSLSALDCWRPRRDLNPCYRRESGMAKRNCNKLQGRGRTGWRSRSSKKHLVVSPMIPRTSYGSNTCRENCVGPSSKDSSIAK